MTDRKTPLISVRDVSFSYGYEPALKDVSLDIYATDYLAIIGPNGGGKTTLLKLILGLLKPDAGQITWPGFSAQHQIGYVPQFATFEREFPLSVRDVVLMGRMSGHLWWQRVSDRDQDLTTDILHQLGLDALSDKPVGQLSGGQLQRVMIARALVCNPDILFLDEPIASIDPGSRFKLSSMLTELNKNIPIVVVTHDITSFASNVLHIACVNRTLFYHGDAELASGCLDEAYGCPVELVAHGVPHRVLQDHADPSAAACTHHGSDK
ncbi:high-affinity zinc uptake system ATP-binding protein ZnuC [bacterium BMS3Bbin11]|nr:high-affinity zinc uptake system ATP-binding protein ZnuC [bacterium BMS3Abin11]GBE45749.1 high-affinity zinc uptake system ATP-binding protein ZnuC [bacterium BMS3Bbin11]GMT40262.1 MAG: zinc ABC transporter ATP-binding protein [bacterium]HDZ78656.1 metal ABC transporter ATP-binding protein [Gammaproteobacteria bacterium]